jgi:hypothetical protein
MITLRKRLSVHDRVGKVTVIDMLNDPAGNNIPYYLIKVFGKDRYLYICQQCESLNQYWVVVDEDRADYWIYKSFLDIRDDYKTFAMFTKQDRSSFKYWFAHWCGFQLTALNLGIWKPKYLLHDAEKPWLKLLWRGDYKRVQKWHRIHNRHHLEYGLEHGWDAIDWEALMIDWECCGLSKQEAQLDARETFKYEIQKEKWKPYATDISNCLLPILNKYNM